MTQEHPPPYSPKTPVAPVLPPPAIQLDVPNLFQKAGTLYTIKETAIGQFSIPCTPLPEPPPNNLNTLHKIPLSLYQQMLGFLIWTQQEFSAEGLIYGFHHPEHGWLAKPPEQTTMGMTVSADNTDLEAQLAPQGYTLRFTAHHHCISGAFQSSTDKTDEHGKPSGLHITLGEMNKPILAFHGRVVVRIGQATHQFDLSLHDFARHIEFDGLPETYAPHLHLLYPIILNASTAAAFPEIWKGQIKRPKPQRPSALTAGTHANNTNGGITAINTGPIDGTYNFLALQAATQGKPLSHFLPMLCHGANKANDYQFRILLTLLCSLYNPKDVLLGAETIIGNKITFKDATTRDLYFALAHYGQEPYDVTGNTLSIRNADVAAKLNSYNPSFTLSVRNLPTLTVPALVTQTISEMSRYIPPPTETLQPYKITLETPSHNYAYPDYLIHATRGLTYREICEILGAAPEPLYPHVLMLIGQSTQFDYILKIIEQDNTTISFEDRDAEFLWRALLAGDQDTAFVRKHKIYSCSPQQMGVIDSLITKLEPSYKALATTRTAINKAQRLLPNAITTDITTLLTDIGLCTYQDLIDSIPNQNIPAILRSGLIIEQQEAAEDEAAEDAAEQAETTAEMTDMSQAMNEEYRSAIIEDYEH